MLDIEQRISVTEMRILSWLSGVTRKDSSKKQVYIKGSAGEAPLVDKMPESRLRYFKERRDNGNGGGKERPKKRNTRVGLV